MREARDGCKSGEPCMAPFCMEPFGGGGIAVSSALAALGSAATAESATSAVALMASRTVAASGCATGAAGVGSAAVCGCGTGDCGGGGQWLDLRLRATTTTAFSLRVRLAFLTAMAITRSSSAMSLRSAPFVELLAPLADGGLSGQHCTKSARKLRRSALGWLRVGPIASPSTRSKCRFSCIHVRCLAAVVMDDDDMGRPKRCSKLLLCDQLLK